MAHFIPAAAAQSAEALKNHRDRQEQAIAAENALLASNPEALAAAIEAREHAKNKRFAIGCGAAGLALLAVAGGIGYGVHKAVEFRNNIAGGIGEAIDKVKPDTKVEISAERAIEKITFPEDLPIVDGEVKAVTAAKVQSEILGFGVPGTGMSFTYKSSGTVGLEVARPDAIKKTIIAQADGDKALGLTVDATSIQATLESFNGDFILGTYDEGQLTEWLGSEGDTVDRGQAIVDHAQTTIIGCKNELASYASYGIAQRALEQIDSAIETARLTMSDDEADAYTATLNELKEQPVTVTYVLNDGNQTFSASREVPATELPLPNKPSNEAVDPYYMTDGQLAVWLGGKPEDVQSAKCTVNQSATDSAQSAMTELHVNSSFGAM